MKRKAMLMGMAVMTGLPGAAMAKDGGKAMRSAHAFSVGLRTADNVVQAEPEQGLPPESATQADYDPAAKAAVLLAQIKSMLRRTSTSYGMVARPAPGEGSWKLELRPVSYSAYNVAFVGEDPRLEDAVQVAVALHLRF